MWRRGIARWLSRGVAFGRTVGAVLSAGILAGSVAVGGAAETGRWWKGNLHTHTLWSDGDDFPEMVAGWYRTNGYHFLALSDHNITLEGIKWVAATGGARSAALARYREAWGADWVETREGTNGLQVRLKTLEEFRPRLERAGKFLMIPSEEITAEHKKRPLHLNATNLREKIPPQSGTNVSDALQKNIDAVLAQRQRTGQPMIPHVNHPNFGWAITAEDLMPVRGERFFEVYNGHPDVRNEGDADHVSLERMWDILLAFRLSRLGSGPLYGLAVDDSHHYHLMATNKANPGRGWIVVRAPELTAASLIAAMEEGDFYASSGVRLRDVRRTAAGLSVEIDPEPGVKYTTTFLGTLRGFDPTRRETVRTRAKGAAAAGKGKPAKDDAEENPVTGTYSTEIGMVLGVQEGVNATYKFAGDEIYVRARITSSKPKANPYRPGEVEMAWVQPVLLSSNQLWRAPSPAVPKSAAAPKSGGAGR